MLDDLCFGGGLSVRQLDEGTGRFPPLVVQAIAIVAVSALIAGGIWRADSEDPPAPAQAVPSNEESPPKLAVLPFVNLSDDPEQKYFSDGVSEDILTALARQETLIVRARQSSFFFKGRQVDPREIAEALDVTYLVNGSVRAQSDRTRVTVRLTDMASNEDIWSGRYDRDLSDVFAVQDEIAETVAAELGAEFSATARRVVDMGAYDALLLGRPYYYRGRYDLAEEHLLKAINHDPEYADAHALLARVYATQRWVQPKNFHALIELADQYLTRALQLDAKHPLALGLRANSPTYPIQTAINELHELISRFPNDEGLLFFYSTKMRQIGRPDLEMAIFERRTSLDPLVARCHMEKVFSLLFYGRQDEMRRDHERCEAVGTPLPFVSIQEALFAGDLDTAQQAVDRSPVDSFLLPSFWLPLTRAQVAYARHDPEAVELALAPVTREIDSHPHYVRHLVALLRGETDAALRHYAIALERGEPLAFQRIHGSAVDRKLFPEFWGSQQYVEMLRT